jgi:hypothetical protein
MSGLFYFVVLGFFPDRLFKKRDSSSKGSCVLMQVDVLAFIKDSQLKYYFVCERKREV